MLRPHGKLVNIQLNIIGPHRLSLDQPLTLAPTPTLAPTLTRLQASYSGIEPHRRSLGEPLFLVLLLQAAMPSAVSVQAIFARAGVDTRPLGRLMIVQYALAMPGVVGIIYFSALVV